MEKKTTLQPAAKENRYTLFLLLAVAGLLRLVLAVLYEGFSTDIVCWKGWSAQLVEYGIPNFYASTNFCDYPPGYMYVLYVIGLIREFVLPGASQAIQLMLIKFPAILCDVLTGYLIYRVAGKNKTGLMLACAYLLNPLPWLDSAIWGQVDSVFTLFMLWAIVFLTEKKLIKAAVFVGIAVLLKPQALLLGPIFLFYFIFRFDWKKLLSCIGAGLATIVVGILPFSPNLLEIITLYKTTLSSYPYATVNAFNLYAMLGMNYKGLDERFFYLTTGAWGTIALVAAVVIGFCFYRTIAKAAKKSGKDVDPSVYFFLPAMMMTLMFMFGSKMHERYLFPVVPLLFIAYAFKRDKRILASAWWASLTSGANLVYVLWANRCNGNAIPQFSLIMLGISLAGVCLAFYLVYLGYRLYINNKKTVYKPLVTGEEKLGAADWKIMVCLTLAFAVLGYAGLGNFHSPQTMESLNLGESVTLDLGETKDVSRVMVFNGIGKSGVKIRTSEDGVFWVVPAHFESTYCYTWYEEKIDEAARYVQIEASDNNVNVLEVALFDENNEQITLPATTALSDEQQWVPDAPSYKNSMYFDEIYHGRTAYEHLHGLPTYEWTHPPLGKELIAVGISLFGMTPFGWRCMGVLFAALMIPLVYLFAKRIFKRQDLAFFAAFLIAVDFMHLAHGRIATIDTFAVFFIILMYYFMYDFFMRDVYEGPMRGPVLSLLASGIAFGLAVSTKWIGIYGGAGLAVLFFVSLLRSWQKKNTKRALAYCGLAVVFFIAIPVLIYCLSYLPMAFSDPDMSIIDWQKRIFDYHSDLTATHPYQSAWYQWFFMYKPLWMYSGPVEGNTTHSIASFGNPAIWFLSLPAMVYLSYLWYRLRDRRILFIVIGFLSQLLPWVFVTRATFIYHFYACVPFVIMALAYIFGRMEKKYRTRYLIVAGVLLLLYLPVLTGWEVYRPYVFTILKAFESWVLCA